VTGVARRPADDQIAIPALLRAARGAYAYAISARLAEAGFDDIPQNGPFVLGGLARNGESVGGLVRDLNVSKQAASQLIDILVVRGYLERRIHPDDRRRMTVELTERGSAAAALVRSSVRAVDNDLSTRISARDLAGLRRGLAALADIKNDQLGSV
jgi:DNA-binding MarR family transcriptional regulator